MLDPDRGDFQPDTCHLAKVVLPWEIAVTQTTFKGHAPQVAGLDADVKRARPNGQVGGKLT